MVLVLDTCILSLAFRRRSANEQEARPVRLLRNLMTSEVPLCVPGMVYQEILSGLRSESEFQRLEFLLRGFSLLLATREEHLAAARIANRCRERGVPAPAPDCLIAAQTIARGGHLLTTDQDFSHMAPHCGLKLVALEDS